MFIIKFVVSCLLFWCLFVIFSALVKLHYHEIREADAMLAMTYASVGVILCAIGLQQ